MVRAAALSLLLLSSAALAQETDPWERYRGVPGETVWTGHQIVWQSTSETGSFYVVYSDELTRTRSGASAWMHGHHQGDAGVPYRSSITRVHFDCVGNYRVSAFTSYMASGATRDNWDQLGTPTAIRPGTVYKDMSDSLCRLPATE